MRIKGLFLLITFFSSSLYANSQHELLIKTAPAVALQLAHQLEFMAQSNNDKARVHLITDEWIKITGSKKVMNQVLAFKNHPDVLYVQPNYKVKLLENYQLSPNQIQILKSKLNFANSPEMKVQAMPDNPDIPLGPINEQQGADPDFSKQWGMNDIGAKNAWKLFPQKKKMVVAVIDSGVDYTHPDLIANLWKNKNEIPHNGIDDDNNGYVDDIIGWDFVSNDNKPYDLAVPPLELLFGGGNPGHGTHCAGNVAARGNNSIGISGVAPQAEIMSLRFISEKGSGDTEGAIRAIKYAVDNGAQILSNSWGSEGEDPEAETENRALRDIIQYAQDHGVLFIAAAGNGHKGVGYDNDSDALPAYPASYKHDNIISVSALDINDQLGTFSNWGANSVDIGAPGVVVYSTIVGGGYNDIIFDKFGIRVTWDGTSMACPHVAGAAALYWAANPEKNWQQVKDAILKSAKTVSLLNGKNQTNGKLDVENLMRQ